MKAHLKQSPPRPSRVSRVLLSLATVASLLLAPFMAASPARADDVTGAEKAIVQLYQQYTAAYSTYYKNGKSVQSSVKLGYSCTGFFVSAKGDIATAGHCVDPTNVSTTDIANQIAAALRKQGADDAYIKAYLNASKVDKVSLDGVIAYQPKEVGGVLDAQGFQVQVVGFKPLAEYDVALLRLNNFSQETPFLRFATDAPEIQQHITAIGFPGVVADVSDAGRQRVSYPDGKVVSKQTRAGVPWVEVSVDLKHGMSGGPVVNDDNQVVGLVSWGYSNGGDEAKYITDLRGLRDFLTANGVQLEAAAPAPQPSSSEAPVPAPIDQAPASDQGVPMVVWIIIGLVVVGGVVTFVVLRARNKAPAQGQQPPVVHPSQVWQGPAQQQGAPPQFGQQPQQWQPQQPNVPPPAQGWPPNQGNNTPPQG